jgi:predicted CXXCH cytochrome family protein
VDVGTTCHRSHNSPNRKLLAKAAPALCYECHDDFSKKKSVHSPVADGECLECHAGHKADREALLTKNYDRERSVEFSEKAYELCFGCHEPKAFADPAAADSTGFRDGNRNLHSLHLVGKVEAGKYKLERSKRRLSCNGCHLVHGSDQEKLVRGSLERGSMTIYTIQFTKTEAGGTCVVGCHKPQDYRQQRGPEVSRAPAGTSPTDQAASQVSAKAMN